ITDCIGIAAEKAVADRVERPAGNPARVDCDELLDAAQHLARRLVRERQQQDLLRIDTVLDEPRNALGEAPRLAAAGSGDAQTRPFAGHHHLELLGIELLVVFDAVRLLRFRRPLERVAADLGHTERLPVAGSRLPAPTRQPATGNW